MTTPNWQDLAAAYVLGALDAGEREEFETRLASDPGLQAEVRTFRELMGGLADAAPPVSAPEHLRSRILEKARATAPISSAPSARAPAQTNASTRTDAPKPTRTPVVPWVLAAAAAVAAVAFGLNTRELSERTAELQEQVAETASALERTAADLAARDSLLSAFLGPDVRTATLAATGAPPSARLFWNGETGSVVLAAFDLPPAPTGRVYQAWGIPDGGAPVSLGTFQTGTNGSAIVRVSAPAGATFAVSAITEEPAGGSPQPTTTPFLVGSWAGD